MADIKSAEIVAPRDYKLVSLLPWLTRVDPPYEPKKPELVERYQSATANLQRADAMIIILIASLYSNARSRGEVIDSNERDVVYLAGLNKWEQVATIPASENQNVDAALSTLLVQAWTTFEVFASDLWESALNIHPITLAQLSGTKKPKVDDDDDDPKEQNKSVDLFTLHRYEYDVRDKMGTILRSRYKFDSLSSVQRAYREAFGDEETINAPLRDESLLTANALRQILVHRMGTADEKYVKRVKNIPMAPKLNDGERLMLDGEIVCNLLLAGRDAAIRLFRAVDDWLAANP